MFDEIISEINESIEGVERAIGDNDYDKGYLDALYMVRDRIVKELKERENK